MRVALYARVSTLDQDAETQLMQLRQYCANHRQSVWAVLKRGLYGVYHQVSVKHLARYVDEFSFRLNEGNVARHTLRRLDSFVDAVVGKRITYKELIA